MQQVHHACKPAAKCLYSEAILYAVLMWFCELRHLGMRQLYVPISEPCRSLPLVSLHAALSVQTSKEYMYYTVAHYHRDRQLSAISTLPYKHCVAILVPRLSPHANEKQRKAGQGLGTRLLCCKCAESCCTNQYACLTTL